MTARAVRPPSLASEIPADLKSASTTTEKTVKVLRILLGIDTEHKGIKAAPKRPQASKTTKQTDKIPEPRSSRRVKVGEVKTFDVHESTDIENKPLPAAAKLKLATDGFNAALRCLTELSKNVTTEASSHSKTANKNGPRSDTPDTGVPLQQRSPNRNKTHPTTLCQQKTMEERVDLVAECASISLQYLRQAGKEESTRDNATFVQQSRAGLLLLDKLIALGLEKKATNLVMELYLHCQNQMTGRCMTPKETKELGLTKIVAIVMTKEQKANFTFVTSLQGQLLRILILSESIANCEALLHQLDPDTEGSPANNIMFGLNNDLIDGGKAGLQLRTISQALLKICLNFASASSTKAQIHTTAFQLVVHAYTIKIKSWELLGHKPHLERELWVHLMRAAKNCLTVQTSNAKELRTVVIKNFISMQRTLEERGFPPALPEATVIYLVDLLEQNADLDQAMQILTHHESRSAADKKRLFSLQWRKTALMQKLSHKPSKQVLVSFQSANDILRVVLEKDTAYEPSLMHSAAKLRKACVAVILEPSSHSDQDGDDPNIDKLAACCIQILTNLLSLSSRFYPSNISRADMQCQTKESDRSSALTALVKSLEALLEVGTSFVLGSKILRDQYRQSLRSGAHCVRLLHDEISRQACDDNRLSGVAKSFSVRLSNLFWQCYVNAVDSSNDLAESLIDLDDSIAVVTDLLLDVQKSASLGMKLEQRGNIRLKLKMYEVARNSFEETLQYYIKTSVLKDAADATLENRSIELMTEPGTKRSSLTTVISSLTNLSLTYDFSCASSGSWYYDNTELPTLQRYLLLEAQVFASATCSFSEKQQHSLHECIRKILELTSASQLRVHQIRFALRLLQTGSRCPSFPGTVVLTKETINEIVSRHSGKAEKLLLAPYHPWLCYALRLQWAFENGCLPLEELIELTEGITSMIRKVIEKSALDKIVDDVSFCVKQLLAVLSYAQAMDHIASMISCETAICHLLKLEPSLATPEQSLDHLASLAMLYDRIGDNSQANETFALARNLLSTQGKSSASSIKFSLAYAEYLLSNNDLELVADALRQVKAEFIAFFPHSETLTGRARLDRDTILLQSMLVTSQLAFRYGHLDQASIFARQAIKISTSIWQAIQRSQSDRDLENNADRGDLSLNNLSSNMSDLALSADTGRHGRHLSHSRPGGAAFWNSTSLHCSALARVGILSMHNGLCQDAQYYFEQLSKLAKSAGFPSIECRANLHLGALFTRAGEQSKAKTYISLANLSDFDDRAFDTYEANFLLIETLHGTGQQDEAIACLRRLKHLLDNGKLLHAPEITSKGNVRIAQVKTKGPRATSLNTAPKRRPVQKVPTHNNISPKLPGSRLKFRQLYIRDKIRFLEILVQPEAGDRTEGALTCEPGDSLTTSMVPQSQKLLAEHLLDQALAEMASDAVKCVLAETTVAVPVKMSSRRSISGRVSFVQSDQSPIKATMKGRQQMRTNTMDKSTPQRSKSGEQLLFDAYDMLLKSKEESNVYSATYDIHSFGKLETKLSLFASTMTRPFTLSSLDIVLQLLQSKELVANRENMATHAEAITKTKDQVLAWPDLAKLQTNGNTIFKELPTVTASEVAGIPTAWNIVSISLAADGAEILVSKLVADQSPFTLRIPLSRSDLDVVDEPDFTYHVAKAEFDAIITQTNASCHDARGQGNKEARQAWYQERQNLDVRLGEWLTNIQNVWLGGFRGLFSPIRLKEDIRRMFQSALTKALDKHLPSRQRQTSKSTRGVELHYHVLELFLGLGHPDEQDLDDAITDLLYFVIDVLQFSGEQNAYDEIDFDALMVDVIDSLRACHENHAGQPERTDQHTILILDKELEAFPWESLPCLQHQAISRMPSLRAVVERANSIRERKEPISGYTIACKNGAYMLNPSADLISTESTFRPILEQSLPSFTSTVRTPPTEASFQAMLQQHELFLYFGHGSGAQYVRGRTIRAMNNCAVTLLMGCSSAKMTECGQFESHGMPGYYIRGMSGCMAMVGTLWDVTDRDIDRFAVKLLAEWGLIEYDELVEKVLDRSTKKNVAAKTKKKTKTAQSSKTKERKGEISLDEAVSKSRDACLLKYLNGAAPVVYGVPVFLE